MKPNHWAAAKLTGTVEVDVTFVGPKAKSKTPLVALIQRHGVAWLKGIVLVTQKNLGAALVECVSQAAITSTPVTKAR